MSKCRYCGRKFLGTTDLCDRCKEMFDILDDHDYCTAEVRVNYD